MFDKNEIIEMARQAGYQHPDAVGQCEDFAYFDFETFAKLVAAKEREACAEICDRFQARDVGMQPAECAGAIRARGEA